MNNTSTEQQIAAAWNAQADEFNQWNELDLGEKIDWAVKLGASQSFMPLSDAQIEKLRHSTFNTINQFCPCDSKTMCKAVRAAERAHGIGITKEMQG